MSASRDAAAAERDRDAWRRDRAAEDRDVRASARDRQARALTGDADVAFADRFLSARDCDEAAADRAAALEDRHDARRDREHAVHGWPKAVPSPPPSAGPDDYHDSLDRRRLIWQGQGVLMSKLGISASEAFELLVEAANDRHQPMSTVADELMQDRATDP